MEAVSCTHKCIDTQSVFPIRALLEEAMERGKKRMNNIERHHILLVPSYQGTRHMKSTKSC
jgi:hypothetical protein